MKLLVIGNGFDLAVGAKTSYSNYFESEYRYSSTEMYVAMTRAIRAIYFITDHDSVVLSVPQGI